MLRCVLETSGINCCLPVWPKIASYHPLSKQGCVLLWFPPLHDWFGFIFPLWNFLHMVVSPHRNMAYFLLQMSSLGIYLLNCKGRKIIHISVIRHARNTSQNPIRLVIKKEKATVWYYVDLKALPEGLYSLIISVVFCFFIIYFVCTNVSWFAPTMLSKLRTKMTGERGESIVLLIHVPLKKHNAQGPICTVFAHNRRSVVMCMLTASDDLVGWWWWNILHVVCFILPAGSISHRSEEATATEMQSHTAALLLSSYTPQRACVYKCVSDILVMRSSIVRRHFRAIES